MFRFILSISASIFLLVVFSDCLFERVPGSREAWEAVKSKVVEIYYTQGWEGVLLFFLVVVGMIFFKVIAYILLSIGVCTLVLAGIVAIVKKQMIIAHINLLLAMYYPTSLFDCNCRNYDYPIKKK